MSELKISENLAQILGYYVYQLIDPITQEVFYIGKGKGDRILSHIYAAEGTNKPHVTSEKMDRINEIVSKGLIPTHQIIRHGLTEREALLIESVLINYIGLDKLSNLVHGHETAKRGLMKLQEIINIHEAPEAVFTHNCILIKINKRYYPNISAEELYHATKESWILGEKRISANYALAIYKGIVKEVYEINDWYNVGKRKGFNGNIAKKEIRDCYINHSVEHLMTHGNQNPIMYTF
jgi:hypothetical protein